MIEKPRNNRWQDRGGQMRKDGILNFAVAAVVLLLTVAFAFALIVEPPAGQHAAASARVALAGANAPHLPA
jgi:hypothetical protein